MIPTLYTPAEAAELIGASVTSQMLRTEIRNGRLHTHKIAGKHLISEAQLGDWLDRCQENKSPQGSGFEREKGETPFGSSCTEDEKSAQSAALLAARKLKKSSQNTSAKPEPSERGKVVSIAS